MAYSLAAVKVANLLYLTEQEMDGEALMAAFATCSGPDCIKDVIKTFGTRLKVYNVIKTAIGESYHDTVSLCCNV